MAAIDTNPQWARALDGSDYLPGMVGLNNIKATDYVNTVIQSLMRVTPLRDFFLSPARYAHCRSLLVHRFGELARKVWHARNFKGQVGVGSPYIEQNEVRLHRIRPLVDRHHDSSARWQTDMPSGTRQPPGTCYLDLGAADCAPRGGRAGGDRCRPTSSCRRL